MVMAPSGACMKPAGGGGMGAEDVLAGGGGGQGGGGGAAGAGGGAMVGEAVEGESVGGVCDVVVVLPFRSSARPDTESVIETSLYKF